MTVINTNVNSLVTQSALVKNDRNLSNAMEQLSTGKRINSARDDAAGLAITSRMSAQIRGLNQAVRNANDGISLLQTTEGATIEMTSMLLRMRELATQSTNDTNTAADREYLDLEYQQLTKEISRTAGAAEWNGMKILNNTADVATAIGVAGQAGDVGVGARNVSFQVGANANQTINIGLKDFSFGTGTAAVASKSTYNLSSEVLASAASFSVTVGGTSFSATLTTALGATSTTAEKTTAATDLKSKLQTAISNTVGFEEVKVESSGSTLSIVDSKGRTLGALTAVTAANAAIAAPSMQTVQVAGSAAVGATVPAATAVFSGNARLNDTDIKTVANANAAVGRLDYAIDAINKERANMGAIMNRLTYASNNLTDMSTNTTASRSRILDTDYAATTTELARTQIIQQAATAMLAQANQSAQSVMALLKG